MEKDFNSWFNHQLSTSQFNQGKQKNFLPYMSTYDNVASPNRALPGFAFSGIPYPNLCQPNESHGWFNGVPRHHQTFNTALNTSSLSQVPYVSHVNHEKTVPGTAYPGSGPAEKRFIVFDQSGDQTTLFFSPVIGAPVRPTSEAPKLNDHYNMNKMVKTELFQYQEPILTCEYNEKQRNDSESEMHEDTEELNALLYSDDEYCEDEEEASTGHSPSTMTDFGKEKWPKDNEEVASNFGPNKRMKLFDGGSEVSPLLDTASSCKPKDFSDFEDDAESSCGGDEKNRDLGEFGTVGGKKRSRKDQIRETVSILQSIIPGGNCKGKDAVLIFDEAIDYLKSLKHKAQVLGVHTI